MSMRLPFHHDIGVICIGEQLTDGQETAYFCYILNRFVLKHNNVKLQPAKPETLDFERRFDEKYYSRILYFIRVRGNNILTMLTERGGNVFTENTFDDIIEISLMNFNSENYNCSCLFSYLCFRIAMVGVHYVVAGGISEAMDWAYTRMLRLGGINPSNTGRLFFREDEVQD